MATVVTDMTTGKRTFVGVRYWNILTWRVNALARHYRKLGYSWNEAQKEAWATWKRLDPKHAYDIPAFLRREMGW